MSECPQALWIEAEIGVSIAAQLHGPMEGLPYNYLYTVMFDGEQDLPSLIRVVGDACEAHNATPTDFLVPGGPRLVVETGWSEGDPNLGLRVLQSLFRPQIPRTALIHEVASADHWVIGMSVLGGYLSDEEIHGIMAGLEASGAQVTGVERSEKQVADVFMANVPVRGARGRNGFLRSLQASCGVFARIQEPIA